MKPSWKGSTLKGYNLLLEEQILSYKLALIQKQEGHGGPGSLTWVSLEPKLFNLPYTGVK